MTKEKLLELINGVTGAVHEQAARPSWLNQRKLDKAWEKLQQEIDKFYAALDGKFL